MKAEPSKDQESMPLDLSRIRVFVDTGNPEEILSAASNPMIAGVTTNAALLRPYLSEGYRRFGPEIAAALDPKPISLPVLDDEPAGVQQQARMIANWGSNIYVKVPFASAAGHSLGDTIGRLSGDGVRLNITGLCSRESIEAIGRVLDPHTPSILSILAGRVADGGGDPAKLSSFAAAHVPPACSVLWASTRQIKDVVTAERSGCAIITVPPRLISNFGRWGSKPDLLALDALCEFQRAAAAILW
jgi:transaldolase